MVLMENVEEIQQWGPLDEKRLSIPEKKVRIIKKIHYSNEEPQVPFR